MSLTECRPRCVKILKSIQLKKQTGSCPLRAITMKRRIFAIMALLLAALSMQPSEALGFAMRTEFNVLPTHTPLLLGAEWLSASARFYEPERREPLYRGKAARRRQVIKDAARHRYGSTLVFFVSIFEC
jgi:hypothetical protein